MKYKRIITIVLDSLGVGAMPDAEKYGDIETDTLGNLAKAVNGINVKNLEKLGLGNLHNVAGVKPQMTPKSYYTKMMEKSLGKDTMTGHWEMMGLYVDKPFITFTETGFPKELVDELEQKTGHKTIGNISASGTEIIEELGERHIDTNEMILYTSADSVLQLACSEETFGLDELYRCCEIAREITMKDQWKVGRVIARPFIGKRKGEFKRTSNRHDYALKPSGLTTLDHLKKKNFDVISVGKIKDIFDGEGITEFYKSKSNEHGMEQTISLMDKDFTGLLFVNLVDFDALWGHRRNPEGYAKELENFDNQLGQLLDKLKDDDLLILTADHGNDPTHTGTDHTREMVPLIMYSPSHKGFGLLPISQTFADIGMSIADNFNTELPENGVSLLEYLV
ncbi:MAG: phosphopentomutase [Erysipelotrichaceae bacterium]|nr:phosphopentomutase [Erysipelotrichaceae bacterium]MDD3923488.1 phosphopentomutase [Erysipelotrichaceae bacterium]MDD4643324.1 phosphopentomutase [Erysipelotrichaceae bacterium]